MRQKLSFLVLLLGLLVFPLGGWAADGDPVTSVDATEANTNSRQGARMWFLCDSDVDAATCTTLLLRDVGDTYIFSVDESTLCTDYDIDIQTQATIGDSVDPTAGNWHTIFTFTMVGSVEGTTQGVWNAGLSKRVRAVINSETACTDIDVVAEVIYIQPER